MKQKLLLIVFSIVSLYLQAQQEFHVFPNDHKLTPGTAQGNGSVDKPWDLQSALTQNIAAVNAGDTIWLHEGVYNGRYMSTLQGDATQGFITVAAYPKDNVTLNGNIISKRTSVLEVKGGYVIFKDFEITWLGEFSRDESDANFQVCSGIRHLTGVNCRFYNLNIHDNPGLGIGSWKHGAGTIIENCRIYNNGFMSKDGKGRGEGIYVQNKSKETRLLKNNIIYNNYYKGIEVWSAGKKANMEFVKHITLEGNIVFNSGSPSGTHRDNVIIASDDRTGINVAKHILVSNNILYHNTSKPNGNLLGDAPSLTIGYNKKAPVEQVIVKDNIIAGGYNALRLLYAKSLHFTNNKVYTGIVQVNPETMSYYQDWNFRSNTFFSKLKTPFRIRGIGIYSMGTLNAKYQLGADSEVIHINDFELEPVLHLSQHSQKETIFHLAVFDSEGKDVNVDFSKYNFKSNLSYKLYDAERPNIILKSGTLSIDQKLIVPMQIADFQKPLHNTKAKKTLSSFGVYIVEFESALPVETSEIKKGNIFKRFFKWLGF
ncbi:parallel beta-helix repeat (two copies) [Formosa sp. Hel1_31_208]|uniref:right-handed parallel beta-helix repeat-containing protein n=1 Tax=Formosa sp. Hel1_31_208 TaxID=1798225 RepID=UPI00087C261D|nr:right-handed parallel beta-helix repeat-containing protein [Formosa sp. Hel1_31_208]SDS03445.1 parallel beta-helix repeat (two copies) [Formosa sp. Hel1_31_208]